MALYNAPLTLVLEQGAMLQSIGRIGLQTAVPSRRPKANPDQYRTIDMTMAAPSAKLIRHFLRWSGAPDAEPEQVPPHLFPQWSLAVASRLAEQTRYPLSGGLNQGCDLQINGPVPLGENLKVHGEVVSVEETAGKARIQTRVTTGTAAQADLLVADLIIVVPLKGKKKKGASGGKAAEPEFEAVGNWRCTTNDGLDFAILTGDFNPIHWLTPVAKMSPFKGRILHGFGSFVRSYQVLANEGDIRQISARFTKPVPIPSGDLTVMRETGSGPERAWKLVGKGGALHAAGSYTVG